MVKSIVDEEVPFSAEEQQEIQRLKQTLWPEDSNSITTFGGDVQRSMADLSQLVLQNLGQSDTAEISELLKQTLTYLGPAEEEKNFLFIKRKVKKILLQSDYDKIADSVEQIEKLLEQHQVRLLMDSALLDQLYQLNRDYHRQLLICIAAAKETLQEWKGGKSSLIQKYAKDVKWMSSVISRLERKIQELEVTALVASQQGPQLLLLKDNLASMASGVQSTLYNVIPLWKNQMIGMMDAQNAKAAKQNELDQMLRESLVAYAKEQAIADLRRSQAADQFSGMDVKIRGALPKEEEYEEKS